MFLRLAGPSGTEMRLQILVVAIQRGYRRHTAANLLRQGLKRKPQLHKRNKTTLKRSSSHTGPISQKLHFFFFFMRFLLQNSDKKKKRIFFSPSKNSASLTRPLLLMIRKKIICHKVCCSKRTLYWASSLPSVSISVECTFGGVCSLPESLSMTSTACSLLLLYAFHASNACKESVFFLLFFLICPKFSYILHKFLL